MPRFLIEHEHEARKTACVRAVDTILSSGSHFLTHAEWGCEDGEHKCWILVDLESKEEARLILPPVYRNEAKITQVKQYALRNFNAAMKTKRY